MKDKLIDLLGEARSNVDKEILLDARSYFERRFAELLEQHVRNHPLGFFYASEALTDGRYLRYHLWPTGWEMPTLEQGKEDHDHTYHLSSMMVAGGLRHRTFAAIDDPKGTHEILEVSYNSGDSMLSQSGRIVRVSCSEDRQYPAGSCYQLRPGTIHRAVPEKLPTATIVLTTEDDQQRKARVLAKVGEVHGPTSFHRGPLSQGQKQQVAASLANL